MPFSWGMSLESRPRSFSNRKKYDGLKNNKDGNNL